MKGSSKILLGVVLGLLVVLAAFLLLTRPGPTDQQQLLLQLETARAAAERHDASGIMRLVSADYKDSLGLNNDQLHAYPIQALRRDSGSYQVTLTPPQVTVSGDTAQTSSHLEVRSKNGDTQFSGNVTLTWRREEGRRFLIFPTKVWRVVGADYGAGLPGSE